MAIVNRTLDNSQQREVIRASFGGGGATLVVSTGMTMAVGLIAAPCVIEAGQLACQGVSGAPTYQLVVKRFIVGTGATAFNLGSANAAVEFGVSGLPVSGVSLPASGSTLNNLLAGDWLYLVSAGANTASALVSTALVIRPIQDIKTYFGLV